MTVSGEGPTLGQRCAFLRLMACNLTCSWCDTPYTWDASRHDLKAEGRRTNWNVIVSDLLATGARFVIVSGGEPLLHQEQRAWELVLRSLVKAGVRVEVETNGTVAPSPVTVQHVERFVVSPKLAHSGVPEDRRIVPKTLTALAGNPKAVFKFVCSEADHVAEVAELAARFRIPARRVWVMPEGKTVAELGDRLKVIADPAIEAGFNVTTRLHIHTWGEVRGR